MQKSTEIANIIGDELRKNLQEFVGQKVGDEQCDTIKANILNYLNKTMLAMDFLKTPEVVVKTEGSFITVNFFDNDGKRLETLDDVLSYMECGIIK